MFTSADFTDRILQCQVQHALRPSKTDHYPIITKIDFSPICTPFKHRLCFEKADWEEIRKALKAKLSGIGEPREIQTIPEFEQRRRTVERILQQVVEENVGVTKDTPFQKDWWCEEIAEQRRIRKRLQAISFRHRNVVNHPVHAICTRFRTHYENLVR